ncbi:MAG: glycosyltransferase [Planctomycetales bacterium]|nr:glycosyltransferase [Planctomycetales bacterium]
MPQPCQSSVDPRLMAPWMPWRGDLQPLLRLPLVLLLLGGLAFAVDVPVSIWLPQRHLLNFMDDFLQVFESFGDAVGIIVFGVALFMLDVRRRFTLVRVMLAALGSGVMADVVKLLVSRSRPYDWNYQGGVFDTFQGLLPFVGAGAGGQSFPSAHVATSMGFALAIGSVYPRGRWLFFFVTALVGLQRVEVGAHFVSDACFGAAVACLTSLFVFRMKSLGLLFNHLERTLLNQGDAFADLGVRDVPASPAPQLFVAESFTQSGDLTEDRDELAITPQFRRVERVSSLSIVIPVFNERDSIRPLYDRLATERTRFGSETEFVFVDDGSTDGSDVELRQLAATDSAVKVVQLRRNFGQTAAMRAGIEHASGDVIAFLDGDLQNDPADLPAMLDKLGTGFDLVQGWRKNRHDAWISRCLPSWFANRLIGRVTGTSFHDIGCTQKVIRREIALELPLYGEMHRFLPILAHWRGARCAEMPTRHHARQFGTSKYGLLRAFRVVLDLVTVKFLVSYLVSPMRLFGMIGLLCGCLGMLSGVATVAMKWAWSVDMTGNPLLQLTCLASIVGLQFFCLGLLGDVSVRTYFESQGKPSYAVRERINFTTGSRSLHDAA